MLVDLRCESEAARSLNLGWQHRGPPNPDHDPDARWRGQRYRQNTGKWANSGGIRKEYYSGLWAGIHAGLSCKGKGKTEQERVYNKGVGKGKEGKGLEGFDAGFGKGLTGEVPVPKR